MIQRLLRRAFFLSALLMLALAAYCPPAAAGFTVFFKGQPAHRCETFAELCDHLQANRNGQRLELERIGIDPGTPAAVLYPEDIHYIGKYLGLLPRHIPLDTPFGEMLYRQLYDFIHAEDRRLVFLRLKERSGLPPFDDAHKALWERLEKAWPYLPMMEPWTESAREARADGRMERFQRQMRELLEADARSGPDTPVQNGLDPLTLVAALMRPLLSRASVMTGAPGVAVDPEANALHALRYGEPIQQATFDPWQAGIALFEPSQGPQPPVWPGIGDAFAQSQFGAPRVWWAPARSSRAPWWSQKIRFMLRSFKP